MVHAIVFIALEAAFQERQKLIQNYQKITSQTDKDMKFAHQQFKHNRASCERYCTHVIFLCRLLKKSSCERNIQTIIER